MSTRDATVTDGCGDGIRAQQDGKRIQLTQMAGGQRLHPSQTLYPDVVSLIANMLHRLAQDVERQNIEEAERQRQEQP